jgi:equilibrative nucleoside transporter 1/2/3
MGREEIKDSYGVVYVIFTLLGTATLLPWNVFLTEKEFYDVRFQVRPYNEFVADNFMSLFALAFNAL